MLTLGQAAKETGISKPTISKSINKGRLSATKSEQGQYQIDPAELLRVFPPASKPPVSDLQDETPVYTKGLQRELEVLREERTRERQQLEAMISDLRHRLDTEAEERRKAQTQLTALLTDQRPKPEPEAQPQPQQAAVNQNPRRSLWAILKKWV